MTDEKEKPLPATANPDNLYWIMSESQFLYLPTRTLFKHDTVVRQLGREVATIIEQEKVCSNLFWSPGLPTFMADKGVIEGELFDCPGNNLLNTYKGPTFAMQGDSTAVEFWLEHGRYIFGDDMDHIIKCLAFKVQHPDEKINHAIVMGSEDQGIGKDTWLYPVRRAVGNHNFGNVTAGNAVEWAKRGFTVPILRKVITRISEVHDLGAGRFTFYDMTKDWCAAPPETLLVADKNVKAHSIQNVVLPIFSTNHKTDGMYWPETDRRNYFAWSDRTRADFESPYWRNYWDQYGYDIPRDDEAKDEFFKGYYQHYKLGADYHVVAYLQQPELIEGFNPGATPRHTAAWHAVVAANRDPQDNTFLDLLDKMGPDADWLGEQPPDALTIAQITSHRECPSDVSEFFTNNKNSRAWSHRLDRAGYVSVGNPYAKTGLWRVAGRRQMIYVRKDFTPADALAAAHALVEYEDAEKVKRDSIHPRLCVVGEDCE